ncbi:MAG TPA: undecaprenyl-diphosphatase UppP [Candidatus Moranbacteria bacterium]|nr:undecaprenyl-diphosphatase UppP [Candidatus Moranbacteria bacterium]
MTLFQAIILGLVQGLGEFLPISSSGHLVILPWLFDFSDPGLSFDIALHLGTLIAIVLYFWKDFVNIISASLSSSPLGRGCPKGTGEGKNYSYSKNLLWLLILATIPGAIFGLLFEKQAETIFRNPLLIAGTLSIAGLVLYLADKYALHKKDINGITKKDAVIIGISQAFSIIPGISRAGATITSGLFLGLSRTAAARFSFLLSAPIIFGATIIKLPDFLKSSVGLYEIIAIITAAVSGYVAIAWLLNFVEKVSYKVFFWYRLLLAVIIVIIWFIK